MNAFLILISTVCGVISLIYAGLPAAIFSFALGFFSSFVYKRGMVKLRENALAEIDRKREPDNKDMLMFFFAWTGIVFCFAIAATAYIGSIL